MTVKLNLTTCPDCAGPTRVAFPTVTAGYVSCRRCGHVFPNVSPEETGTEETGTPEETGTRYPWLTRTILDGLPDAAGYSGEVIPTGGGCMAISIGYGAGYLLVTDGDASLPDTRYPGVVVCDYTYADESEPVAGCEITTPTAGDILAVISSYLNGGDWQTTPESRGALVTALNV